ncbi:Noc4 [Kluyveromyces lactis]|nr:Noc4 [Kluyveromyces lactis]
MLSKEEIKQVWKSISTGNDRKHYNSLVNLIHGYNELLKENELLHTLEDDYRYMTIALSQIFIKLFERGQLMPHLASNANEKKFFEWCKKLYLNYKVKLLAIITSLHEVSSLSLDCLDSYMKMLHHESIYWASKPNSPFFPNKTLRSLLAALFHCNFEGDIGFKDGQNENSVFNLFVEAYYKKNFDIQFYTQSELISLLPELDGKISDEILMSKWLALCNNDVQGSPDLEIFVSVPPQAIENDAKFKSNLETNWLHCLNLANLSSSQYKTVLLVLHKRIIVWFHHPTRLMDFLTDSYNQGGIVSILSLNGLFELMKKYNLEYPNFYSKLYQLLTPELMHVKYRSRFFRLLDTFLSSTHLSAQLVASFIKRLARLSVLAPPGAIVSIIPFVYNLIRKHPTCMILLHDPEYVDCDSKTRQDYLDPFNNEETNPELTNALSSSVWELETLMNHYHPNVATLAKIFQQPFQKLSYNIEDFLDWSYDSLLQAETNRKLKIQPALEFERFETIFESGSDSAFLPLIKW